MSSRPFAKKSLGQHFLRDATVVERIMQIAGSLRGKTVFEVGPGPGVLTRAILERDCERLVSIDKDERARQWLTPLCTQHAGRFELIIGDALKEPLPQTREPAHIISNLPYNVGTALFIRWLYEGRRIARMTLMFQKEVAQRITAVPDTADYGRLAVLSQILSTPEICFDIPPEVFDPPPKVWSCVITVEPKDPIDPLILKYVEELSACAFNNRRKMLRVTLGKSYPELTARLPEIGINAADRPQSLTPAQFTAMGRLLKAIKETP